MLKELKKLYFIINARINTHAPYAQHEKGVELLKSEKKGLKTALGHFDSYTERIEQLKASSFHIDIVSDGFKLLDSPENSSFRGIIHYLDKKGKWNFTDTGTYKNIFECIQETIEFAEHIKENWL